MELYNSSAQGIISKTQAGIIQHPMQGTPYLGPKVQTCHLVPCLGDALGVVGVKNAKWPNETSIYTTH